MEHDSGKLEGDTNANGSNIPASNDISSPQPVRLQKRSLVILGSLLSLVVLGLLTALQLFYFHLGETKLAKQPPSASSQGQKSLTESATPKATTPHLLFADYVNGVLSMKDSSGDTLYNLQVSKREPVALTDISPDGEILLNFETNTAAKYGFMLVDKTGKSLQINQDALNALIANLPSPQDGIFMNDDTLVNTLCSFENNLTTNDCKLVELNLSNGQQKTLLETTVPRADVTNASASFYVMRLSADKKTAYIYTHGSTKLGSNAGLYSYNLSTGASKFLISALGGQELLSPDCQELASIVADPQSSSPLATLHARNIASGTDTTTVLSSDPVDPALAWSPNSDKLLYHTTDKNDVISIFDVNTSEVTKLQTTPNDTYHMFDNLFWIDENHITYALDVTSTPNSFSTGQTFKEDLTDHSLAALTATSSTVFLVQIVNY